MNPRRSHTPASSPRTDLAKRAFAPVLLLCLLGFLAGCQDDDGAGPPPAAEAPPKPTRGVVLISIDTLRADHLGTYGYDRDTSPFLDSLAARGVVFERTLSPIPSTLPAHVSMLTGLHPREHLVLPPDGILPDTIPTLAERFQDEGYVTAGFTDGGFMSGSFGFARGFDEWNDEPVENGDEHDTRRVERILQNGLDFVASLDPTERFFLFLHTYSVHDPYDPPEPYRHRYWERPPPADLFAPTGPNLMRFNCGHESLSPEDQAYFVALYDAGIRYTDATLRSFFERLATLADEQDLTIVVTSDHGEEFLEHDLLSHAQVFHHNLHVPLIVLHPGLSARRVDDLARLVDVTPTIADLAGLPSAEGGDGQSLVPALRGDGAPSTRTSVAKASTGGADAFYLDVPEDDALYQYVRTPFKSNWLTPRGARFEVSKGGLSFRALSYLEPRTLEIEVDGESRDPILIDHVFRGEGNDPFQQIDIPIPDDGARHVVRLHANDCAPVQVVGSPDCRCLSFHVADLPETHHALFEVRSDPGGAQDRSNDALGVRTDLEVRLEEARRAFRARANPETTDLDPAVIQRLKALGYL